MRRKNSLKKRRRNLTVTRLYCKKNRSIVRLISLLSKISKKIFHIVGKMTKKDKWKSNNNKNPKNNKNPDHPHPHVRSKSSKPSL